MSMSLFLRCLVVALAWPSVPVLAAADLSGIDMEPGLWHLNVQMDIPGQPTQAAEAKPMASNVCLRPTEVAKLVMPANAPCQVEIPEVARQRLRIKLRCDQGGLHTAGEGIMVFNGRNLSSALVIQTAAPYAMTIKQTMTGKYLGPCPDNVPTGSTPLKPYGK
jgi:hypothetical protein